MTVAYDSWANPTTNTGGGISSQSWSHVPVGTLGFAAVLVQMEDNPVATITSVTWGIVPMTMHSASPFAAGESPTADLYLFTLDDVPAGTSTVTITYSGTLSGGANARSVGWTGDSALELHAYMTDSGVGANPKAAVACTKECSVVGMLNSGQDTAAAVSVDAFTTSLGGTQDVGATQHAFARLTANTSGTDGPGWTVASEDYALYALAVAEVDAGGGGSSTAPPPVPATLRFLPQLVR